MTSPNPERGMRVLTYGSVCSGIEAASVAWHPLGWRASFLSEIEPFPRAVLAHHYSETPLHGDFTTIAAGQYEPIDLLVGGTPCQSFSVAGLRGGLDDDRGNLALEYLRLADRLRPRWLVWENVPGVLSSNGGRDFGAILGGMVELGYGVSYRVLDAKFFGVAQRRRRVFVVGHLGDWRRAAAVLFERHSLSGNPAPRREAGKDAATIPSRSSAGGGLGTDFDCDGGLISSTGHTAHCLNAGGMGRQDYETETLIAHSTSGAGYWREGLGALRGREQDSHENLIAPVAFALRGRDGGAMPEVEGSGDRVGALRAATGGSSRDYVAFDTTQITSAANYSNPQPGAPCPPLASGAHPPAVAFTCSDQANSFAWERPFAPTLNAQIPNDTSNIQTGVRIGAAVRRLTPRECERLQGFPDDYTLIPWRKGMASDAPRYKALGNSMAVPVMRWIGERIAQAEAISAVSTPQQRAA